LVEAKLRSWWKLGGFLGVVSQRLAASQAFQLAKFRDRKGLEIGALPGTNPEDLGREVPMSNYLAKYLVHASDYTELSLRLTHFEKYI
jgi:hypothetical protein